MYIEDDGYSFFMYLEDEGRKQMVIVVYEERETI